jgi:hypothetical protein
MERLSSSRSAFTSETWTGSSLGVPGRWKRKQLDRGGSAFEAVFQRASSSSTSLPP